MAPERPAAGRPDSRVAVALLMKRIADPDWADRTSTGDRVKENALAGLRELAPGRVSEALRDALRCRNENVRAWAAARLVGQKEDAVTADLVKALADHFMDVRTAAARSLGRRGDRRAAAALARRVADGVWVDRRSSNDFSKDAALDALRQLDPTRVTAALLDGLRSSDGDVRAWAAKRLGAQKDKRVVEALTAALGDADGGVRAAAAEGLGRLGDPAAVPALVRRVADDGWGDHNSSQDPGKDAALEALRRLAPEKAAEALTAALQAKNADVRDWAARRLAAEAGRP
jgi:HEAT repeat protein